MIDVGEFDRNCEYCRHGVPIHWHTVPDDLCELIVAILRDEPVHFEIVGPTPAVVAWRDYKAGFTRRPRKGDSSALLGFSCLANSA